MKTKLGILGLFLLFACSAYAQTVNNYYLPQVAMGSYGDGSFRTSFIFFNNHDTAAFVVLELTDDSGNPMTATIPSPGFGTDSQFAFQLPAGATKIVQTDNSGSLRAGAAKVTSTSPIGVSGIFTIYDTQDNFVTEAGVGNSQPMTDFVIPVEASGDYGTGLALFNPGSDSAALTAILLDKDGIELARRTDLTVDAGGHKAFFVTGAGQMFPTIGSMQGTLTIQSTAEVSAMVLRQNASRYYTSLPVVSRSASLTAMSLAQVANGTYDGGSFRTSFLLFSTTSNTAHVTLALTLGNGSPFPVTIPGYGTNSTFNFTLEAGKALFLQTDGSGSLAAGAARITSDVPIGGTGIFTVYDNQMHFQTEAGVGDSAPLTQFTLPVDLTGKFDTGVAFYNPGTSQVKMTLRFMNANGENSGTSPEITLGPKGQSAAFVSQIFPSLSNIQGSVAISATGPVGALTLRQNSSPYGLTTLPVVAGTASGTAAPKTLLTETQTGVSATSNVTVNKTLPAGFRLSGTIQGGFAYFVVAESAASQYYGTVDFLSGKYLVVVPSGTYTVKAIYLPTVAEQINLIVTYTHPNQVQVLSDTTLDITLPAPALFTVTGSVSGMSGIPNSTGNSQLVFTIGDNSVQGLFGIGSGGAYSGSLPAGTYRVSLITNSVPSGLLTEELGIYDVGTLTVSGNTAANYAVPGLVTLSGTVNLSGVTANSGFISATDTANLTNDFLFLSAPRSSVVTFSTGFSGAYQMLVPQNRTLSMNISYTPATITGTVSFPVTMSTVNLGGNGTYNFNVPGLPGQVTISGHVTDGSAAGVANVAVSASTESLTGAANTMFGSSTTTDSNGNYSLTVLSGTNYQMTFTPPPPSP